MPIVFQAQLPHPMMPLMRGPRDTQQPQGHGDDQQVVPGALAPPDEPQSRPGWRELLERYCTPEVRKAAADNRRDGKTPKELREEENPPWRPEDVHPLADIGPAYQESQEDEPTLIGHTPVERPLPEISTINQIKLELLALRDPAEATSTWLHALHIACKDCICRDVRGAIVTRFMHVFWSRKLASKCA